ncbi:hypothetical protein [Enterococcus sp. ZJ1622]|uniref:hypothetical protein n=1 Tax=Enterococcus sp. ZJ1622 TaxID=2709401 RepID=UPI0013EB6809|nr:hypothetical protein [Enterococcus sp. ZJ1622]
MQKSLYNPLIERASQTIDLKKVNQLTEYYESDILYKISQSQNKKLSIKQYTTGFSLKEKRCFLGLLKHFKRVKITYCLEAGVLCQYLIMA